MDADGDWTEHERNLFMNGMYNAWHEKFTIETEW